MPFAGSNATKKFVNQNNVFEAKEKSAFSNVANIADENKGTVQQGRQTVETAGKATAAHNNPMDILTADSKLGTSSYLERSNQNPAKEKEPVSFDGAVPQFRTENDAAQFYEKTPDIRNNYGYSISENNFSDVPKSHIFSDDLDAKIFAAKAAEEKISEKGQGEVTPQPLQSTQQNIEETPGDNSTDFDNDVFNHEKIASFIAGHEKNEKSLFREKMNPVHFTDNVGAFVPVGTDSVFDESAKKDFRNKTVDFIEKVGDVAEDFQFDKENAAASNVDEVAEKVIRHSGERAAKKATEYGFESKQYGEEIRKGQEKIVSIDEQIRKQYDSDRNIYDVILDGKEKKESSLMTENSSFKESHATFQIRQGEFTDPVAESFRTDGKDVFGNDLFADVKSIKSDYNASALIAAPVIKKTTEKRIGKNKGNDGTNVDRFTNGIERSKFATDSEKSTKVYTAGASSSPAKNWKENDGGGNNFEKTEIKAGNNKELRSVDSYFSDSSQTEALRKQQKALGAKEKELQAGKKNTDKEKNKQIKKASARAAVSNFLNTKRNLQNDLGDMSGQGTGDLLKDGYSGLLRSISAGIKHAASYVAKSIVKKLWGIIAAAVGPVLLPIFMIMITAFLMLGALGIVGGALTDSGDESTLFDEELTGDGKIFSSLSAAEIESIISNAAADYGGLTVAQEQSLRYALNKVGCPYNQAYHSDYIESYADADGILHYYEVDIFDCSSLAYRAYDYAGIDISFGGTFTAAYECQGMEISGKQVMATSELKPGDLLFYGGANNGRYKGVYHVAIYCGNGKMVEARGVHYGVVYGDVRMNNLVSLGRPW